MPYWVERAHSRDDLVFSDCVTLCVVLRALLKARSLELIYLICVELHDLFCDY